MTISSDVSNERPIRELLAAWAQAVRQKDIERLIALHTPDLIAFDAWGPLSIDAATHRDHWEQCFAGHGGAIELEHRDVVVVAGEDVAFASCLVGMRGVLQDGTRHSFWGRGTFGLRRVEGRWLIAHAHASAPFDPYTGNACTELEP